MTLTPTEGPGHRPAPPLELLRLRSATKAYLAILADSLPAVEAMAAYSDPPELILSPDVDTPVHDLAEAVRAAIEVTDAPGTPAAIERLLAAAGADRPIQAGDRVTIRFESGRSSTVQITNGDGVTTTFDIAEDSPLATALLGKRAGDRVELELAPGAVIMFTVLRVG